MEKAQKIEVIAIHGTDGQIRPLRIRFAGEDHELHRLCVDQIVSTREVIYVGIEAMIYLCRAREENRERIFELRYNIRSHDWHLLRWVC